jgi:hypothetical protein
MGSKSSKGIPELTGDDRYVEAKETFILARNGERSTNLMDV